MICDDGHAKIWLEPSHGHTPGHVHVRICSQGEEAVITGDLMHHPIQCAMPWRPARFDMDTAAGQRLAPASSSAIPTRAVMVIGAHFADPTAGWIRSHGEFSRFEGIGLDMPE